jgi:hypothetical protein
MEPAQIVDEFIPATNGTEPVVESYYRMPRYLSPTALKTWQMDRLQYYRNYLSPLKPAREPQTVPMSVGSAFDAYAKSHLHKLYVNDNDPKFAFDTLFEAQVEPQNRDRAKIDGKTVFDAYIASGALQDLILKLNGCVGKPRFEFTLEGIVNGTRPSKTKVLGGVPLLGKPDLEFTTYKGVDIIADWKVNGFYSKNGVSPTKGYTRLYPSYDRHKDCMPVLYKDITINGLLNMESCDADWAAQLATYAWLLGKPVGSNFVAMIHQLVCRPTGIRTAELMMHIGEDFQHNLLEEYQECWYRVQDGLIFDKMTAEESLNYAKMLDNPDPAALAAKQGIESLWADESRPFFQKRTV